MKRSEIKPFKCFTGSSDRTNKVIAELKRVGFKDLGYNSRTEIVAMVFRGSDGGDTYFGPDPGFFTRYLQKDFPEMTFGQVMEMLKSIEPEERGMWVVRDISENGDYSFNGEAYNWQELPRDKRAIFGGWLFPNHAGWQVTRKGETPGYYVETDAHNWVKPLIPTKIRFWVP